MHKLDAEIGLRSNPAREYLCDERRRIIVDVIDLYKHSERAHGVVRLVVFRLPYAILCG